MFRTVALVTLVAVLTSAFAQDAKETAEPKDPQRAGSKTRERIAVADFSITGNVEIPEAGKAVAELLLAEFAPDRFQLVERTHLAALLQEHDLTMADIVENPALLRNKKLAGVRYMVFGSVIKLGNLAISARLVDVTTGDITQTAQVEADDARGLQGALGELAAVLQMTPEEKKAYSSETEYASLLLDARQKAAARQFDTAIRLYRRVLRIRNTPDVEEELRRIEVSHIEPSRTGAPRISGGLFPVVRMETTLGHIVVELDAEKAPITVNNFIKYASDKFYDGTVFHRVIKTFMIQGGGYTAEMDEKTTGLRPPIKNEWQNGLKNKRGTISMARKGGDPDSASAQFFINVVDNDRLDQVQPDGAAYCVFGKVVEGLETVDKIRDTAVTTNPKYPGGPVVPAENVVIKSVAVVGNVDPSKIEAAAKSVEESAKAATAKAGEAKQAELGEFIKKIETETGKKATKTGSGLIYFDLKGGNGATPKATDNVDVHYTGWLVDGTKFDSSVDRGQPFTFSLGGGVIKGWLEGVASMKVGGKRKLIIPSDLGYGKRGSPPAIPSDATLVFDVELLRIKK